MPNLFKLGASLVSFARKAAMEHVIALRRGGVVSAEFSASSPPIGHVLLAGGEVLEISEHNRIFRWNIEDANASPFGAFPPAVISEASPSSLLIRSNATNGNIAWSIVIGDQDADGQFNAGSPTPRTIAFASKPFGQAYGAADINDSANKLTAAHISGTVEALTIETGPTDADIYGSSNSITAVETLTGETGPTLGNPKAGDVVIDEDAHEWRIVLGPDQAAWQWFGQNKTMVQVITKRDN